MSAKLHINVSQGLFEVEGSEEFVKQLYAEARSSGLFAKLPKVEASDPEHEVAEKSQGKRRQTVKRGGPSCASRIQELKDDGFFADLRETKAISDALASKGYNYEGKHIAASLLDLTKRGSLRRIKKDGNWVYQNP